MCSFLTGVAGSLLPQTDWRRRSTLYSPPGLLLAPFHYVPDKYVTEKAMISGRENVFQEWDWVRDIGANLMQVYIAYTALFGN